MNTLLQNALNVTPTSKSKYRQGLLARQKSVPPQIEEKDKEEEEDGANEGIEMISRQILNKAIRGNVLPTTAPRRRILVEDDEDEFEIVAAKPKAKPEVKEATQQPLAVIVEQSPISKEPKTPQIGKGVRTLSANKEKMALALKMLTPSPTPPKQPSKTPKTTTSILTPDTEDLLQTPTGLDDEFEVIANPNETTSWNTKYIPRNLGANGDFAGHQDVIIKMKKWLMDHKNRVPQTKKAAMLIGPPGIGKTSLVFALSQQLGYEYQEFNPFSDTAPVGTIKGMKASSYLELNVIPRMAYRIDRPTIIQLESADTFGGGDVFKSLYLTETGQKKKKNNSLLSAPLQLATGHFKANQETVKVHPNGTKYFTTSGNEEIYPHPLVLTANEKNESFSQLAGYCEIFYMDRLADSVIAERLQQICAAEKLQTLPVFAWNKEVIDQKSKSQLNREMQLHDTSPLHYDQVVKGDMLETDVSSMVIAHREKRTTVKQDFELLATEEFKLDPVATEELLAKHDRNVIRCTAALIGDFKSHFQSRYCITLIDKVIRDTRNPLSAWKMLREESTRMLKQLISVGCELEESENALCEAQYDLQRAFKILFADEGMYSLVTMGFSVSVSRDALVKFEGNAEAAKDFLFQEADLHFHKKYFISDAKVKRRTAIYREIRIFDLDRTYTSRRLPAPTICHLIASISNGDLRRAVLLMEICSYVYRNHETKFPGQKNHFDPEACMTVIFDWSLQDTSPHAHSTFQFKELCEKPTGFRQLSEAFELTAGYVEQIMHTHLPFLISSGSSKLKRPANWKESKNTKTSDATFLCDLMSEVADLWAIGDNFENDVFSGGRGEAFVYKKVFSQVMPLAVIKEAMTLNYIPLYFGPNKKVSSDFSGVDMQQLTGAAMFGMPRAKYSMTKHMMGVKSALVKADCLPPPSSDLCFYRENFIALFKSVWSNSDAMHTYLVSWLDQNRMPIPLLATIFRLSSTFLGRCDSIVDARHFKKQKAYTLFFRDGALNSEINSFLTEQSKHRHIHNAQMMEVPVCKLPEFETRTKEYDGFIPMENTSIDIEILDEEKVSTADSNDILEKIVTCATQIFSALDVFLKRQFTLKTMLSDSVNEMLTTIHTTVKTFLFTRCKDEKTGKDFFFIGAWFKRILELQKILSAFQLFYAKQFLSKHPTGVIHAFVTTLRRFEDKEVALTKELVLERTKNLAPIHLAKKHKATNEMFIPESDSADLEMREIIRFDLERSMFALTFAVKHLNEAYFSDLDKFALYGCDDIQNLIVGPERPTAEQLEMGLTNTELIRMNYSFADRLLFCAQIQTKLGYTYESQNTFRLLSKKDLFSVRMERGYKSSTSARGNQPQTQLQTKMKMKPEAATPVANKTTKKRSFEQNEAASTRKKRKTGTEDDDLEHSPCFSMQEKTIAVLPSKIKTPIKKVVYSFDF